MEKNRTFLNDNPNEILYVSFNQEGTNVAIGTENGFKIINIFPFLDLYYRNLEGGIGIIEMLNKSNILALVGGGKNPKYPLNELILWDEDKNKEIVKIKTKKKILNVKLNENKIYIVNIEKILVFDFNTLNLIETFYTKNPKGLISLCYKEDIIAYPDINHAGTIKIKNYKINKEYTLKAHKTPLNCIQLNQDGKLIGTCSLKGTLIRVYNIEKNQLIREVRRGAESANVYCIAFDMSQKYFAVTSDRKTIHIFFLSDNNTLNNNINYNNYYSNNNESIEEDVLNNSHRTSANNNGENKNKIYNTEYKTKIKTFNADNKTKFRNINKTLKSKYTTTLDIKNRNSVFKGMSTFFNVGKRYFGSEWSFSKIKFNGAKSLIMFGPDNSVIIVTYDGKYYQASFDPINGGEDCY